MSTRMDPGDRKKRSFSGYFRLLGIVLLVFILSRLQLDALLKIIKGTEPAFLLAAVLLNVPHFMIKALRWHYLLKSQDIEYPFKDSLLAYTGSTYFGFFTPGRFGELVKAFHLRKDMSIPVPRGAPSVIVDRLCDLYLVIIVGTVGLWRLALFGKVSGLALMLLALLAGAPLLLLSRRIMEKLVRILFRFIPGAKRKENFGRYFEEFFKSFRELMNRRLSVCGLLTAVAYLVFFLQCYCLARSLGITEFGYVSIMFLMSISNFITMLPVSIAGLGTRDAILIYLFSLYGLDKETAVGFSMLVFFSFYLVGGLLGFLCWIIKPIDMKKPG